MTFWGIRIILKETHREHLSRQSWEPSAIPEVEDQLLTGSWWRPEERQIRQQNTMWIIWGYAMHRQIYLYYIILYYVMLCYFMLYCIVLYYMISYHIILYYVMLCYIILYYIYCETWMRLCQAHCQENKRNVPEFPLLTARRGGLTVHATPWSQKRGRHFGSLSFFWQ